MKYRLLTLYILFFVNSLFASDRGSPLMNAVNERDFKKIVKLINSGENINKKNKLGFTALLYAAGWGDLRTVKYLIKNGASLKSRSNRGFGVIHRASMNINKEVLKYLLENYSFDVNDRGKTYCSPLDFSLRNVALQRKGTLENTKLLLEAGANESINWKCQGYTPLMISTNNKKVIKYLLKNGADKTIKNASGFTAYDIAKRQNASSEILQILKTLTTRQNKKVFNTNYLVWEIKSLENKYHKYSKKKALSYCKKLKLGNYSNWRIPTVTEYKDILTKKPFQGYVIDGIDKYYFNPKNFPNMVPSRYWTFFDDSILGYQSVSQNFFKKITDDRKFYVRCVTSME